MRLPAGRIVGRIGRVLAAAAMVTAAAPAGTPALKSLAPPGLRIGAALSRQQTDGGDARTLAIVEQQFNSITPENVLKWEAVHPDPDRYDFAAADRFVAFGQAHGMFVVGHTLVWHHQTPGWVFAGEAGHAADRATLLARLRAHIFSVVGRYRGRVHAWDVVNEALEEDGSLRPTPWLAAIGEDYIEQAFAMAHEVDPDAELYYNDYNLWKPAKRDGAIRIVKRLSDRGLRIDGVGEQAHWGLTEPPIAQIDETIAALAAGTGRRMHLSELDVDVLPRDPGMWGADLAQRAALRAATNVYSHGLPAERQRELASRYGAIFGAVLRRREHVSRVTFWGVTDAQSWLNDFPIPGRINYPLLWDRRARPKPAFDAVVEALRATR
jgi:endo-1,4-beta-xylanase